MENYQNNAAFQVPKKNNKKKWFFLGLGLVSTGILSFFGYQYWKKHKTQTDATSNKAPEMKAAKPKAAPKTKPKQAPAAATAAPAKKPINAALIATGLHASIISRTFNNALKLLNLMKSTADYQAVNAAFGKKKVKGVTQTVVNAMLSTFTAAAQKESIRKVFSAMGLKYDGKKWSLSGIDDKTFIITTQATTVWKDPRTSVPVPLNMVLGSEVAKRGKFTLFENEKQFFLVESGHVKNHITNN